MGSSLTQVDVLDLYFLEARCKLIEVAAFMDRVERAPGGADFRWASFCEALGRLTGSEPGRAEAVLRALSDPTVEPLAAAPGKGAVGAWPGFTDPAARRDGRAHPEQQSHGE